MNQFYVTLPSNTENDRDNGTGEYRVDLAHTLEFSGDWEVGLASIQYPFTWENFVDEKFYFFIQKCAPVEVMISNGNYEKIEDLLHVMNSSYAVTLNKESKKLANSLMQSSKEVYKKYAKGLSFEYSALARRVEIHLNGIDKVFLSKKLQYTLGFLSTLSSISLNYNLATYPVDLTCGFTSLYIYTDIIKPQLVGNVETTLLRTIPVKGNYGETLVKDYSTIHYVDLLKKRFDSISISIKDDTDSTVKFLFGKTILKLHFRKKRFI